MIFPVGFAPSIRRTAPKAYVGVYFDGALRQLLLQVEMNGFSVACTAGLGGPFVRLGYFCSNDVPLPDHEQAVCTLIACRLSALCVTMWKYAQVSITIAVPSINRDLGEEV